MDGSNLIALAEYIYNINDISPKQLGITSRQINHWIDKKIAPFIERQQTTDSNNEKDTKKKWIRLNVVQATWVCIIKELLSLGTSIDDLEILASKVWDKPRKYKYADKAFEDNLNRKINPLSDHDRQTIESFLNTEILMENEFRTVINPFTDTIKSVILRNGLPHSMIYVPEMIEHDFLMNDGGLMIKLSGTFMENTIISIPIVPIISKILAIDFNNPKKELSYLSDIEKQIRDIVVFKKPKKVEIAFENNEIKPITITEQHKTKEQLAQYILENKIAQGSKLLIDVRSQGNYKLTLIKK